MEEWVKTGGSASTPSPEGKPGVVVVVVVVLAILL
jgi:hypothetical protein